MASRHDTMMNPPIEGLLERAGSKFTLVTLGAKRARQINSYYNQLSEGLGTVVPPQVTSSARKPLSIAFEEIDADKILGLLARSRGRGRRRRRRGHRVGRVGRLHPGTMLEGKRIVLGVSGGIAAYKAVEVCRRLVDAGAHVIPVLTDGRAPLRRPHHLRRPRLRAGVDVALGRAAPDPAHPPRADGRPRAGRAGDGRVLGAATPPASATTCSRNVLLATRAPVLVCPAMHTEMWEHPAVQDNLRLARARGVHVVEPESGRLAGGDVGTGRLADPATIVAAVDGLLAAEHDHDLTGLRVVVTAGRHPRADRPGPLHRQPLVGQAGPRGRRGGRRAAAPRSRSSPRSAIPASAGIDVVQRRHRRRDGARRAEPAPTTPTCS